MKFQQELETLNGKMTPPAWASKANYYFENAYGEQWIAYLEEDQLYVSGGDIGWKVMQGDLHDVIDFLEISDNMKVIMRNKNFGTDKAKKWLDKAHKNPFFKYSLNGLGENTWLCSVMETNISTLEMAYNKKLVKN